MFIILDLYGIYIIHFIRHLVFEVSQAEHNSCDNNYASINVYVNTYIQNYILAF